MRRMMMLFLLLCTYALYAQEYELVWKDDFRGRELDGTKWSRITRGPSDWRRHMSLDDALYDLRNGRLVLRAMSNDGSFPSDTSLYLTGGVCTRGKFSVSYGKVEVRARLEGGRSVWPAIWMLPEESVWPDGGEIDLMERLNHDDFIYQTVHTRYTHTHRRHAGIPHSVKAVFNPDRFNVFGVEILPEKVIFSVNGNRTLEYPRLPVRNDSDGSIQYPFGAPFYILMDMQIGGEWVGPPDGRDLPVEMLVDWVKVYELKQ